VSQATVRIPAPLLAFTRGVRELTSRGRTVGEVLDDLGSRFHGLSDHILDDAGQPERVCLYVGSRDVRRLEGRATPIDDGAIVTIVPRVHGS